MVEFARHGNLRDFLRDRRRSSSMAVGAEQSSGGSSGASSSSTWTGSAAAVHRRPACTPTPLSDDEPPYERQLTAKDLLSFAFQTARGMDYLAAKMVRVYAVFRLVLYDHGYSRRMVR